MLEEYSIVKAVALDDYRLHIVFNDGIEGTVDLTDLKGRGVFKIWNDYNEFRNVKIDPVTNTVCWRDEFDLDPVALRKDISKNMRD